TCGAAEDESRGGKRRRSDAGSAFRIRRNPARGCRYGKICCPDRALTAAGGSEPLAWRADPRLRTAGNFVPLIQTLDEEVRCIAASFQPSALKFPAPISRQF